MSLAILKSVRGAPSVVPQRAFPTAEGFGKDTTHARGKSASVIKVTNLNDSGAGSFRAAMEDPNPRYIVFDVSGVISLSTGFIVRNPYYYVAGQTSPGGILIEGNTVRFGSHDWVARHIRFRPGGRNLIINGGTVDPDTMDGVGVWGNSEPGTGEAYPCYNWVIDHCSMSWGSDENFGLSYNARNGTFQYNLSAQGLTSVGHSPPPADGNHNKGPLFSGKFPDSGGNVGTNWTVYQNFFAHQHDRNPRISSNGPGYISEADVTNNVLFNYPRGGGLIFGAGAQGNIRHNYAKRGPQWGAVEGYDINWWDNTPQLASLFLEGNINPRRLTQTDPQWCISGPTSASVLLDTIYQKLTAYDFGYTFLNELVASSAMADAVIAKCGAGAGGIGGGLDSIDQQFLLDYAGGLDNQMPNIVYPTGYPIFTSPAPTVDWSLPYGYDPLGHDLDPFYENIEVFLYQLAGDV